MPLRSPRASRSLVRLAPAAALVAAALLAGTAGAQGTGGARPDSTARDSTFHAALRDSLARIAARDSALVDSVARAAVRDSIVRSLVAADSLAVDSAARAAASADSDAVPPVRAARVDSLAAEVARELERRAAEERAAAAARRDSLARVRAERLAELRAGIALAPRRPRQGTLVRIVVPLPPASDSSGWRAVRGTLAGEPLHFEPAGGDSVAALGAIPIETAPGSITATLLLEGADGATDTLSLPVPVASGEYRLEKLTVRPAYGAKPDSALQARIDREYEQAVEVSRRSHDTPRLWRERWLVPRETRVTSGFGNGREFNGVVQSRHMGVDYAGPAGSPVRAANRGVVALIGDFFLGGNVVYIDHGAGLVTAYLHLSRVDVAVGDTVERGARIGLVGSTGRSTGPHLHWIARYGDISVDARGLLALPAAAPEAEDR